nr:hypothetical protein [Tanacetum cinerariifolium]
MDEALVPHSQRLRIEKSNFRLLSDFKSKESTLKVIIHHFMLKDPSIPRRNKVNRHYVRDDHMFSTIKLVSRHQNTQLFGALLPIELTNKEIKISNAYKEYYAIATVVVPPKPKASVRRTRSSSDTSITPLTAAAGPRLTTFAKGKQAAKASKAKNEGTGSIPGVLDVPTDESEEELSWNSIDDEGADDEGKDGDGDEKDEGDDGEEGDGDDDDDKDDDGKEGHVEKEEEDELYRDVKINQGRGIQATLKVEGSHVTLTSVNPDGQQQSSSMSSQFVTSMLNLTLDVGMESIFETTSQMDVQTPTSVAPLPMTAPTMTPSTIATTIITSQAPILSTTFAGAVSAILGIVQRYMDQRMYKAVKVAIQIQYDRLRDEAQRENDEFLKTVDENMQKIIKEQVKEQVKTSYAVAVGLSEMELKKILIEKMEGNKSIQRFDEQRNLYNALIEAYESDKIILDTYRETVTLKRRRDDDADKDEEPFRWTRPGVQETSTQGSQSRQALASESTFVEEPMQTTFQMEEPSHPEFDTATHGSIQPWISELSKLSDSRSSFNELMDTPLDFSNFLINRLKVDTLTPKLLAGPTYELIKGSCKSLVELEYHLEEVFKATKDQLDWVNPKHALWGVSHWRRKRQQFYGFAVNRESARDVYSKRRIIIVTELKIVEWHSYKHLDWITVRRDDDKLYKFKEGDFKRLCIQDIEDMLLLIVQGKLTNLTVEERFTFNKKLNLTKPDSYRSDLKHKEAYTAYSNLRGFIYQNKDKKNRLMRIDELHKFSNETLTNVRTTLDDRLKGIRMQYLPQSIWRKSNKDRAVAMIQAINKRLKTRRIMRRLKRFVRARLYEGDFRMLQRTI